MKGEFNFDNPPAMGGPLLENDADGEAEGQYSADGRLPGLLSDFSALEAALDGQQQQLVALETLMMDQKLRDRVNPKGRPVKTGWLSSYYGKRTDPINGRTSWHKGVDFAGKYGNDVVAVGERRRELVRRSFRLWQPG